MVHRRISPSPWQLWTLRNIAIFLWCWVVSIFPNPQPGGPPLSVVRDCLFIIFASTLHIGGSSEFAHWSYDLHRDLKRRIHTYCHSTSWRAYQAYISWSLTYADHIYLLKNVKYISRPLWMEAKLEVLIDKQYLLHVQPGKPFIFLKARRHRIQIFRRRCAI